MNSIRALVVAIAASSSLSACVGGLAPQANLRPGGSASLAAVAAPEPVAQPQRVSAAMPGDLLFDPKRSEGGIDPVAVLARSEARHASEAAIRTGALAEGPKRPPVVTGALPTSPLLAAHMAPTEGTGATAGAPAALLTPTPLADVEARAALEQKSQTRRDQRFDAQVRRASTLVCSGCVTGSGRSKRASAAREPDDAGE